MTCPKCDAPVYVVDTRPHARGLRRRRHCKNPNCGYRFTSIEQIVDSLEPHEIVCLVSAVADVNTAYEALARAQQALRLVLKGDS